MFKTTKAKVIFVAIFSIICLIVTAILIVYQRIEIEDKEENIVEESKNTKENDYPGIDLKGTYNQNDLQIEEKAISQNKIEIRYPRISGLKNKNIENKINKEIEQIALNCYKEKIKDLNEVINVQVDMWVESNFANTISFQLTYYAKIDDNDDGSYLDNKGINYDLNTGKKITINKLFTADAPIENILRKSAYYSLIENYTEPNLAGHLTVTDYGNIEDDVADIIYLYKSGQITEFYYTPKQICFFCKDNFITIDMEKWSEYIAIYNRFLSKESLFENNNVGIKNIYTLATRYKDIFYYTNYQNENNYFIDISIDIQASESDIFAKELANNKIMEIEDEIEKVKQIAVQNPNEFYILNYYIMIYTGEEPSLQQTFTSCFEIGNAYEMTVHDFEENIEPIIMEYNRQAEEGAVEEYIYNFSDLLKIEPQETIEYYNPETGEKIVI